MKTSNIIKSEKGGAVVEFAIVLPLLAVLLFGIIEFSLLFYNKAMITNASREGARAGIVYSPTRLSKADIQTVVNNYCASHLITFGASSPQTDVDPDPTSSAVSGAPLTVTVTYTYEFLVFPNLIKLLQGTYSDTQDLTAVTVMRYE